MRVMDALLHIPDEDDPILFCGPDDSYGFMSTTARFDVDLDGRRWRSVEHYYQAQKFAGHPEEELVRATKSVREASRLGRTLPELRNDWASVRDGVMTKALRAKFTQDADLRRRLLGTGSRALVLHSAENNYWGDGGDGSGQNRLGELLMQVRAELLEALAQESGAIRFYRVNEPYGFMSNFAKYPVDLDGKRWPTSEHYFQAQKFAGSPEEEHIRSVTSADEAARLGRRLPGLRPDWEAVKDDVMLKALRAKFVQHATLRRQLLETGDRELVEHTRNDSYWADGGDGSGRNRLGELLMQVRQELREGGGT